MIRKKKKKKKTRPSLHHYTPPLALASLRSSGRVLLGCACCLYIYLSQDICK
eukprot:SAG31_NODE_675_length_12908_cov_11.596612_4_plen_52_part_00